MASGTTASRSQIAIHEQRKNPQTRTCFNGVRGRFTIELKGDRFGTGGTTVISPTPGPERYVNGQEQTRFTGSDKQPYSVEWDGYITS